MKTKIIIFIIVIIASFLRLYQLDQNPPSLTWDEVAWGYNAYSLGIDGKDEFGKFLPYQYLESFGDFKPPMYAYLDVLPIKIFGLNEFAIRLPSAFFGILTVLITYFLTIRIFFKSKNKEYYGLMASFVLAISPWHIMLSRAAFEANVATFFLVSGIWLFLIGIQERKWALLLSAISFALSFYTFNTSRIVAPLLVLMLVIGFRRELMRFKKEAIVSFVVGVLLILPIVNFLLSPQAQLRFKEVNIFSDIEIVKTANQEIANDNNALWSKIIHNRRLAYGVEYLKHYFDNFKPDYLFIKGDGNPKFSTQRVGELYLWDLPFIIVGILFLIRKKESNWWIIPIWLILGIIPAATARETPHALRTETILPTMQILIAYGFVQIMLIFNKYRKITFSILILLLLSNFVYFYHDYQKHYAREFSGEWQYGYKDSINFVKENEKNYDKVMITTFLGRPYIYYLLYLQTDPKVFRQNAEVKRDAFGFVDVSQFGKYHFFKGVTEKQDNLRALYINDMNNVPKSAKVLKTFYLLNGNPVLAAYTL